MKRDRYLKIIQLSKKDRIIGIVIITFFLLITYVIPEQWLFSSDRIKCFHLQLFGFQCPFCGSTRAIYKFTHLDIIEALQYNFAAVVLIVLYFIEILSLLISVEFLVVLKRVFLLLSILAFIMLYIYRLIEYIIL